MKKIYTILFLCVILLLSTEVKAQIVKGEAFMGLNLTQIDGDKAYGYNHLGFHGGLGALVPIYNKDYFDIDFSLEVVFNHKGAHQGRIYADCGRCKIRGILCKYDDCLVFCHGFGKAV